MAKLDRSRSFQLGDDLRILWHHLQRPAVSHVNSKFLLVPFSKFLLVSLSFFYVFLAVFASSVNFFSHATSNQIYY